MTDLEVEARAGPAYEAPVEISGVEGPISIMRSGSWWQIPYDVEDADLSAHHLGAWAKVLNIWAFRTRTVPVAGQNDWHLVWTRVERPEPMLTFTVTARTFDSITVAWTAPTTSVPPISGWILRVGSTVIRVPAATLTYTVSGLQDNTTYHFRLASYAASGTESEQLSLNAETLLRPPANVSIGVTSTGSSYPVNFTAAPGKAYRVRYTTDGTDPDPNGAFIDSETAPVTVPAPDDSVLCARVYVHELGPPEEFSQPSALTCVYTQPSGGPTFNWQRTESVFGNLHVVVTPWVGAGAVKLKWFRGNQSFESAALAPNPAGAPMNFYLPGLTAGAAWHIQGAQYTSAGGWGPWVDLSTYTIIDSPQYLAPAGSGQFIPGVGWNAYGDILLQGGPCAQGYFFYAGGLRALTGDRLLSSVSCIFIRSRNVDNMAFLHIMTHANDGPSGQEHPLSEDWTTARDGTNSAMAFDQGKDILLPGQYYERIRTGVIHGLGCWTFDCSQFSSYYGVSSGLGYNGMVSLYHYG